MGGSECIDRELSDGMDLYGDVRAVCRFGTPSGSIRIQVRAVDVLEGLVVARERWDGYDRDLFVHWTDEDADGCDTRREVLLRDAHSGLRMGSGPECRIVSGVWYSVYDDVWVEGSPAGLHVDHVVPLQEAWDSGAHWRNPNPVATVSDMAYGSLWA